MRLPTRAAVTVAGTALVAVVSVISIDPTPAPERTPVPHVTTTWTFHPEDYAKESR
jgi:hypothetical protein